CHRAEEKRTSPFPVGAPPGLVGLVPTPPARAAPPATPVTVGAGVTVVIGRPPLAGVRTPAVVRRRAHRGRRSAARPARRSPGPPRAAARPGRAGRRRA